MGRIPRRNPISTPVHGSDPVTQFLSPGSMVEVSNDEEGFDGAWYVAKILNSISSPTHRLLVQYQTLVSETDPDQLLVESAHVSFIRPVPPPPAAGQTYELLDVVDAFHRDGWWKGVVSGVKFEPRKYTVVFENPPEEFDFGPRHLRLHLDWVSGNWVRPPKRKGMPNKVQGGQQPVHVTNRSNHSNVVFALVASSARKTNAEGRSSVKSSKNLLEQSTRGKPQKPSPVREKIPVNSSKKSRNEPSVKSISAKQYRSAFLSMKSEKQGEQPISSAIKMELEDYPSEEAVLSAVSSLEHEGNRVGDLQKFSQSCVVVKDREIPFTKSSNLWKYIESQQVFQCLPQNPHFQPLSECSETSREAVAITHMLSFMNLVEKVSNLRIENPTSEFESCLKGLADLEMFGFDVQPVVDCVNELLSLKRRQELLDISWTNIHQKIAECDRKKEKFEEEINAIDKMRCELEEQRALKASLRLKEDSNSDFLQSCAMIIKDNIFDLKRKFEQKAAGLGRYP